jgi:hypothetical protein
MKRYWVLFAVVLCAITAGAWALLRPPEAPTLPPVSVALPATPEAPRAPLPDRGKLAASEVLKIDPRAVSVKAAARPAKATLYYEYLTSKQLKALYDRIKAGPEGQTPEGSLVMYEMLRRCANIAEGGQRPPVRPLPKREDFMAALSPTDPNRDKRIAAYEEIETNRCAGFEGVTVTRAELNKLLADAAAAGSPTARALLIEQEAFQAARSRTGPASLTDAQLDTLRQLAASRDPAAIVAVGRLLSNTWQDLTVRVGADGTVVEPRAFMNAWQILACDYGHNCGAANERLLSECAVQGHCDASSLPDHLFFYGGSPHDSQLVTQYQAILRAAIETGDWSQLSMVRGARPPGTPRMFFTPAGPGRR